jgi:ABC-type maltose transport system permease subunit
VAVAIEKQLEEATAPPGKRRTLRERDARLGVYLISPTLIIVLVIVVFPLLWSILISFQRLRLIEVGTASFFQPLTLANYQLGCLLEQHGHHLHLHRRIGGAGHRSRAVGRDRIA